MPDRELSHAALGAGSRLRVASVSLLTAGALLLDRFLGLNLAPEAILAIDPGTAAIIAAGIGGAATIGSSFINRDGQAARGSGQGFQGLSSPFLGQTFGLGVRGSTTGARISRGTRKALSAFQAEFLRDNLFAPGDPGIAREAARRGFAAVPLFGPLQSGAINRAILEAVPFTPAQESAFELLGGAPATFEQLFNPAAATAQELAETGLRTDIDPIRQAAVRALRRETAPLLAERFAAQTGTFGTDFGRALADASADVETELGALQTQLDEAAAARRQTGAQLAANLGVLPAEFAGTLFNLGETQRLAQEEIRPGARLFRAFQILSGLGQPGATGAFQTGFAPSQTSQTLGALSQIAPAVSSAIDLFRNRDQGLSQAELARIPEPPDPVPNPVFPSFGF